MNFFTRVAVLVLISTLAVNKPVKFHLDSQYGKRTTCQKVYLDLLRPNNSRNGKVIVTVLRRNAKYLMVNISVKIHLDTLYRKETTGHKLFFNISRLHN